VLAGGARQQAGPPGQPGRAGAEAAVPAAAGVELADELQQAGGGGVQVGGQLGDLVTEALERGDGLRGGDDVGRAEIHGRVPLSAGATLHRDFGALWQARLGAIAAGARLFRAGPAKVALRARTARWEALQPALPAGGRCARTIVSSGIFRGVVKQKILVTACGRNQTSVGLAARSDRRQHAGRSRCASPPCRFRRRCRIILEGTFSPTHFHEEPKREWDGRYYGVQQVAAVVAEEPERMVVVTVYAFCFQEGAVR